MVVIRLVIACTVGAFLTHKESCTDKFLSRAESLVITSCSNSSSQLDASLKWTCSAECLKGTSISNNSNKLFTLKLSVLQVDLNYWNNMYYQDSQLYKSILRAESLEASS